MEDAFTEIEREFPGLLQNEADVHARKSAFYAVSRILVRWKIGAEFLWWSETLWSELRSLAGRMRLQCDRRQANTLCDCGYLCEVLPSGQIRISRETIQRTQDTGSLLSSYPWGSDTDVYFFLLGWTEGRKFSPCRDGSGNKDKGLS